MVLKHSAAVEWKW